MQKPLAAMVSVSLVGVLGAALFACEAPPASTIKLAMRTPQGLLDEALGVELVVFDASQGSCRDSGGVTSTPADAQRFQLSQSGCEGGGWCATITLDRDDDEKVFHVEVRGDGGLLGQGCTTARVDQDPLSVRIRVLRFVPEGCCNDGVLQIGEQCDTGAPADPSCDGGASRTCGGIVEDPVCNCDCTSKPVALDRREGEPPTAVGASSELSLTFARGADELADALRAVWLDTGGGAVGGSDIGVRMLSRDLYPLTNPLPLSGPLRLPLRCTNVTGGGLARQQRSPRIAEVTANATAAVYLSDEANPSQFDAFLSHQTEFGCADAAPVRVNLTPGGVDAVDVAPGPAGAALVVFSQGGAIRGRFWTPQSGFDADVLTIAALGSRPRVAGSATSWVVVYEGSTTGEPDGVLARTVTPGPSVSDPFVVNAATAGVQDRPDVAMLPDGRFAVAFQSGGDVFVQRYGAAGVAVEGDQVAPVHENREGDQVAPALASGGAFGGFFVVAWEDHGLSIGARFLDGSSGFLFNSVTGQNGDFVASPPSQTGERRSPAVAVGGAGHVAIGWQELTEERAGVVVRRFPLPGTQ